MEAGRTLLFAAIIISLLTVSAFALGYGIYRQRQAEIRQNLQIDENNVGGYAEFEPEEEVGAVLHSALRTADGATVYVSVSPVERSEAESYILSDYFLFSCNGGESWGTAFPYMDDSSLTEDDYETVTDLNGTQFRSVKKEAISRMTMENYDEETKSLLLKISLISNSSEYSLDEPVEITLAAMKTDQSGIEKVFGTINLRPIEEDFISVKFAAPVEFENPGVGKGQVVGARLYAGNIVFELRHDDMERIYSPDGKRPENALDNETQAAWMNFIDGFLRQAQLHFADGTVLDIKGGAAALEYDGELVSWPMHGAWQGTIDISQLEFVSLAGQTAALR